MVLNPEDDAPRVCFQRGRTMKPVPPTVTASAEALPAGSTRSGRALARPGVAWGVLALCLLATTVGWRISLSQEKERARERFDLHVERLKQGIRDRILSCEQVLKGAAGLFAAGQSVQRHQWHDYVATLDLETRYPGIHALGFAAYVSEAERQRFLATTRLDGAPEFAIQPPGLRSSYYVVKYVEPVLGNSSVLGWDMATESRRREAADVARDTGEAVLTRKIKLVQSAEELPAALLLLPIYRHGQRAVTMEERRAALQGWVCAAFVLEDLMAGLLENRNPEIDCEIFDDTKIGLPNLLYDADGDLHAITAEPCTFKKTAPLDLARRTWTLSFSTRPAFDAARDYTETRLLVFGGMCISLLLFGITRSLASTR